MMAMRPVRPSDQQAFARFERDNRGAHEHFNEPYPEAYYSDDGLRDSFADMLALNQHGLMLTTVLAQDGGPHKGHWFGKGALFLWEDRTTEPAMLAYQTDHRHQGQGIATALMAELIAAAQALQLPCVDAVVTDDHHVSRHLLARSGFRCVAAMEPAVLRRGTVSCLRLRLTLDGTLAARHARAHVPLAP
jgi:RimJ/RimL family protein N-acetyltransferase